PGLREQRAAARALRTALAGVRDGPRRRHPQPPAGRAGRPGTIARGRPPGATLRRGVDALMSCDQCREREAVIHLTQIVNEQVTKLHLCERCAAEKGVESPGAVAKTPLGSFLAAMGKGLPEPGTAPRSGDTCSRCGGSLQA